MLRRKLQWGAAAAIILLSASALTCAAKDASAPKDEFEKLLDLSRQSYAGLKDYTCIFVQRERIDDKLLPEERTEFKFRKPFMVYMRWVGPVRKGQECLYAKGRNDDRIVVRATGALGLKPVKLDPVGRIAMSNRRHPITEAGIGHLLDLLQQDRLLAAKYSEGSITEQKKTSSRAAGKEEAGALRVFECVMPKDKRPEYYCCRAVVAFDAKLALPVKVTIFDVAGDILEEYSYENLKVDVGLTDADFDRNNPSYGLK